MNTQKISAGYTGKIKTGSPKPKKKFDTPKPKIATLESEVKKPRKRKDTVTSDKKARASTQDEVPTWIQESSKEKPSQKSEIATSIRKWESKLQWRKETKKSQRSFSKNKERDYVASKPRYETDDTVSRKPFGNTFEKKQPTEGNERKSSWDKNSVKPGTGFKKSKTGYKWIESTWNKSDTPRVSTRTWDDERKNSKPEKKEERKSFPKPSFEKETPKSKEKKEYKKERYIAPKPTWEKEIKKEEKRNIKDPTK